MIKDLCFEIIQKCTNHCSFCSSNASIRKRQKISYKVFKNTVLYLHSNFGIEEISLSGGEPFLHEDLFKMVELCKSLHIKTNVYTSGVCTNSLKSMDINNTNYSIHEKRILEQLQERNCSSISKSELFKLKELGLDKIIFDIQTLNYDTFRSLMNREFNIVNLLSSMAYAKSAGLELEVNYVPMKPNSSDIEDILEICDIGEVSEINILKFVPQGRGYTNRGDLTLTDWELKDFCSYLNKIKNKYKVKVRFGIPVDGTCNHLCTAGYNKMAIKYDGTVYPCVAFKNIKHEEISKLLISNKNSFKMVSVRTHLNEFFCNEGFNKVPLCKQMFK